MRNTRFRHRGVLHLDGMDLTRYSRLGPAAAVLAMLAMTAWSYGPIIAGLFHTLRTNDDYSPGQLVPLAAVFLVWRQRKTLRQCLLTPCWRGGMALLLLAELTRLYGFLSMRQSLERYALMVAGLQALVAKAENRPYAVIDALTPVVNDSSSPGRRFPDGGGGARVHPERRRQSGRGAARDGYVRSHPR